MTKTITVESVLSNIADSGTYAVTALVNAYLGDQPVSAQILKNVWTIGQFVDNNGRLMPLTKAAMAAFMETPEWRDHPVVKEALRLKQQEEVEKSADEKLLQHAMRAISFFHRYADDSDSCRAIWLNVYDNRPMPQSASRAQPLNFYREYVENNTLTPLARKAAERMIAEGTAPSRELLGLEPVHEVRITFPTKQAAETFLRKWASDIGSGVTAALKRLATKAA